jgi:chromosomal replication initiator protein
MMNYPLNIQTAHKALGDMTKPTARVTMDDILEAVSSYYSLRTEDLLGPRRSRSLAVARQVAMYLARDLTAMSLPQVGQALGGRDHTTVMHGCEKIAALFEKDDEIRHQILEIRNKLYSNGQKVPAPQGTRRS